MNSVNFWGLAILVVSCTSKKNMAKDVITEVVEEEVAVVVDEPFYKGTISDVSSEEGCTWIIITDDGKRIVPVKELESGFQKDGLKVLFQYRDSRIKSTCSEGNPGIIERIQKQ